MKGYEVAVKRALGMLKSRIIRIIAAVILLCMELYLLLGPTAWVGESKTNWLTGEGSWAVSDLTEDTSFCQRFVPEYDYLESVSLLFQNNGQELDSGSAFVRITDEAENVVWSLETPYENINWGSYTDFLVEQQLKAGKEYLLWIQCGPDADGECATLSVCSMDYYMPENKVLSYGQEIDSAQLVSRYVYQYAVSDWDRLKITLLCVMTALALGFGVVRNDVVRKVLAVGIFMVSPLVLGRQLEFISLKLEQGMLLPNAIWWNVLIMYLLEVILLVCSCSLRFSIIISNLLLTVIYSADYFVRSYRNSPLKWNDLTAAGTAVQVLEGYDLRPNSDMAISWALLLFIIMVAAQVKSNHRVRFLENGRTIQKKVCAHVVSLIAGLVLLAGSVHVLINTDFLEKQGFQVIHGFDEDMMYQYNGYLVSTCLDVKSGRLTEPEGYSAKRAQEILQGYPNQGLAAGNEEFPHIVLIMNESFSDLRVLGDLQISEENMEFFYGLTENTVRGTVNASVLGGGTANSEFEVLLGCSMGLLPRAYYPYQQCIKQPVESIVSDLEAQGYTSYSMHPETKNNWNRDKVYDYLGFDNSYWAEDFEGMETVHKGASDRATYQKVQELFENREEDEKMFIFDLTLQNHGSYGQEAGFDSVKATNVNSIEADNFLSLMKESDQAFGELITYFEKQDEKVIVCMFGDHQPKFSDESFYTDLYQQTEDLTERDKVLNQYVTPFVVWANYDIAEQTGINISMNYLGVLLQEAGGLPLSPHFSYLKELMKEYPVITANGYVDGQGTFCEWSGNNTEFSDYRIIQYYRIFEE